MRRRALVIILTDNPGGAERVACAVSNALAQRGWEVELDVVCREDRGFVRSATSPEIKVNPGYWARERVAFPAYPWRLVGRRFDLVFTTHVHTNALLSALRASGIVSMGSLVSRESTTIFDRFRGLKRLIFRAMYRLYGSQDLLIAQTRYMREHVAPYVRASLRRRTHILPNPVDLEAIMEGAAQPLSSNIETALADRENIVFCGRLIEVKQPLLALQAYARALAAQRPDERPLVFMGDGPLRPALEAASRKAGLAEDDVVFLGRQSNPYAVMRRCHYGILTSSREGFPNVVLEMMATGVRKIVVTPCAGDLDLLSGVTITPDFQVDSVAEALEQAIASDEDRREDYRRIVASRSVDAFVDDMLARVGISGPQPLQTIE
jgi:glycosyltransferase involved in cell wall biosynthesis